MCRRPEDLAARTIWPHSSAVVPAGTVQVTCWPASSAARLCGSKAEAPDRSIIGDGCWINHGATMHGTQIADGGAVGINAACDYNTRIGKGAILANGSATRVDQVIADNCFAEGVPAVVKKRDLTDQDRLDYFGVLPSAWTRYEAGRIEESIRKRMGR